MTRFNYEHIPLVQPVSNDMPRMGQTVDKPKPPSAKPSPKPEKLTIRIRRF